MPSQLLGRFMKEHSQSLIILNYEDVIPIVMKSQNFCLIYPMVLVMAMIISLAPPCNQDMIQQVAWKMDWRQNLGMKKPKKLS
jgi:hypothetical protein